MRVGSAFPSKYLRVEDLNGRKVPVTIEKVVLEDVGDGDKPVVFFTSGRKGLVLNKTNAESITEIAGTDEMDDWSGIRIVLTPDKTMYQGKKVACIRILEGAPEPTARAERPAAAARTTERRGARQPEPEPVGDDDVRDDVGDDDVPF